MQTCNMDERTNEEILRDRIKELEFALQDAMTFSELVETWGRTDCEIYKSELKHSADLSIGRISKALNR